MGEIQLIRLRANTNVQRWASKSSKGLSKFLNRRAGRLELERIPNLKFKHTLKLTIEKTRSFVSKRLSKCKSEATERNLKKRIFRYFLNFFQRDVRKKGTLKYIARKRMEKISGRGGRDFWENGCSISWHQAVLTLLERVSFLLIKLTLQLGLVFDFQWPEYAYKPQDFSIVLQKKAST